jgi:hypothetical protein
MALLERGGCTHLGAGSSQPLERRHRARAAWCEQLCEHTTARRRAREYEAIETTRQQKTRTKSETGEAHTRARARACGTHRVGSRERENQSNENIKKEEGSVIICARQQLEQHARTTERTRGL